MRRALALLVLGLVALPNAACSPLPDGCHAGGTPFDDAAAATLCYGIGTPLFDDATAAAGVGQVHAIPEGLPFYARNMGGGAVLDDLDGDGDLDLFVTSGHGPKALYWNHGDGTFDECAEHAGVAFPDDWTHGVSAADYDNDGFLDLYLLNRGANRLLRNRGDGTFEDVTARAGVGDAGNSASAAWADVDGDGFLELFVANLAASFTPKDGDEPAPSRLYRSRGDGSFEDASSSFDPPLPPGSSFSGLLADLDDDGAPELFLTEEFGSFDAGNRLYTRADGARFREVSAGAGVELPAAVMGMAILDVDADARPDLFLTDLRDEPPNREALLRNQGDLRFGDEAIARGARAMNARVGAGEPRRTVGWGAVAGDLDNDGDDDLYVVYGQFVPAGDFPLDGSAYPPMRAGQQNAVLRNDGGVVEGDVDGDGCLDLYVVNQEGPSRLLHNRCASAGHWLAVDLEGRRSNRDAIGARVTVRAGGAAQTKWIASGTSVHSAMLRRLHFGLGAAVVADAVTIRWPDGREQELTGVPVDLGHRILEP